MSPLPHTQIHLEQLQPQPHRSFPALQHSHPGPSIAATSRYLFSAHSTCTMADKTFWALTCSMLSLCGFLFLLAVGVLVKVQPQYMKISKSVESPAPIFESAVLYGALFVASSMFYYKESKRSELESYDLSGSTSDERLSLLDKPVVSYS
ncbi:hypothetical protein PHYPSEUDO_015475 [Phytophthora pseudosyringae]|uniref:Transmembrane protein n=1 Tax=Phytophthora pseudosyringae TaxID=221518 RepID=A0A8T1VYT3_9STRA|nr:hypothetical protein PHYPSEUDO_015475 [Phytophthora pseudosyringae]